MICPIKYKPAAINIVRTTVKGIFIPKLLYPSTQDFILSSKTTNTPKENNVPGKRYPKKSYVLNGIENSFIFFLMLKSFLVLQQHEPYPATGRYHFFDIQVHHFRQLAFQAPKPSK